MEDPGAPRRRFFKEEETNVESNKDLHIEEDFDDSRSTISSVTDVSVAEWSFVSTTTEAEEDDRDESGEKGSGGFSFGDHDNENNKMSIYAHLKHSSITLQFPSQYMKDRFNCFVFKLHSEYAYFVFWPLVTFWIVVRLKENFDDYMRGDISLEIFILAILLISPPQLIVTDFIRRISEWQKMFKHEPIDLHRIELYNEVMRMHENKADGTYSIICNPLSIDPADNASIRRKKSRDRKQKLYAYIKGARELRNLGNVLTIYYIVGLGVLNYSVTVSSGCKDTCMNRIPILSQIVLCMLCPVALFLFNPDWWMVLLGEFVSKIFAFSVFYMFSEDITITKLNSLTILNLVAYWMLWIGIQYSVFLMRLNTFKQREIMIHVSEAEERKRLYSELFFVDQAL